MKPKANPEEVCNRLIPKKYRRNVFEALSKSIKLAHRAGPDKWGIRLAPDSIMLKMGPHEIVQLGDRDLSFHIIVDDKTVPAHLRTRDDLWFSDGLDYFGELSKGYYKSNPGSEACNISYINLKEIYEELFSSHIQIVTRAAQKRIHTTTKETHSIDLIQYISKELGETLPQPAYIQESEEDPAPMMTEEISTPEKYFEGTTFQVMVNAYERNRSARNACIKHYGYKCVVCEFSFEEKYGEIGLEFIHVHHIVEISTIGEKYSINPVEDLRPVCPNCHAMLHRRKPTYSIQELIDIIKKQNGG
jgi:5-methylcytosine-specific restriction protein A